MIIKKISTYIGLILFLFVLNACQNIKKYDKPFKHNTPLIKDKDIVSSGKSEISKTLEMGPKPIEGDAKKLGKRKKISSESQRNYLIISDDYPLLKQRVTLKFKNLDYKDKNIFGFEIFLKNTPEPNKKLRQSKKSFQTSNYQKTDQWNESWRYYGYPNY